MDLTTTLPFFTGLVLAVGVMRLVEMRISRGRQRAMAARGVAAVREPHFRAMVLLHTGILVGCLVEAWATRRPMVPALAGAALALVVLANALRLWVIATLGQHWNVQIMDSMALGVISDGPYRHVRHPNYVAVFFELLALPLVHGAYVTAGLGALAHLWVLSHRIRAEETVLLADPGYRTIMGPKPRFVPRLGGPG